jgi:hypothetical protein
MPPRHFTPNTGSRAAGPHALTPPHACARSCLQVQSWRVLGDAHGVCVQPTTAACATVWDALQGTSSGGGKGSLAGVHRGPSAEQQCMRTGCTVHSRDPCLPPPLLISPRVHERTRAHPLAPPPADVSGESMVGRALYHPTNGLLALLPVLRGAAGGSAHGRLPLLQLLLGGKLMEGGTAAVGEPLHTSECVRVCERMCVRVCACVCVRLRMRALEGGQWGAVHVSERGPSRGTGDAWEEPVQGACEEARQAATRFLCECAGLGFWTRRDSDAVVSKLRFPRYAHVIR